MSRRGEGANPVGVVGRADSKRSPEKVRAALDGLVNYLAVVEGLDSTTNALLIGFRPDVKKSRTRSTHPEPLPKLAEQPSPPEFAPEGGLHILDLRAVLLELAGQPGRVRQDHGLYAKEQERFLATMLEAPEWAVDEPKNRELRLEHVIRMIQTRGFVEPIGLAWSKNQQRAGELPLDFRERL